jgi:hypothetical protein
MKLNSERTKVFVHIRIGGLVWSSLNQLDRSPRSTNPRAQFPWVADFQLNLALLRAERHGYKAQLTDLRQGVGQV